MLDDSKIFNDQNDNRNEFKQIGFGQMESADTIKNIIKHSNLNNDQDLNLKSFIKSISKGKVTDKDTENIEMISDTPIDDNLVENESENQDQLDHNKEEKTYFIDPFLQRLSSFDKYKKLINNLALPKDPQPTFFS